MAIVVKKIYNGKPHWYIQENSVKNGKMTREFLSLRGPGFPKYFETKQDAKSAISKYSLVNDHSKSTEITLKTARDEYLLVYEKEVRKGTISQRTFDIFKVNSQNLIDDLGYLLLKSINIKTLQLYVEEMSMKNWSNRYIQMHLIDLNKIFKFACWEKEWIHDIPRIPKIKVELPKSIEVNTPEQVTMLLEHANQSAYKLINLIWNTGIRPKEARLVKLHQVNFDYVEGDHWIPYLKVRNVENKGGERLITLSHKFADELKLMIGNDLYDPIDKLEFLYINGIDSDKKSREIWEQLHKNNIIDSTGAIKNKVAINDDNVDLGLNCKFVGYKQSILRILRLSQYIQPYRTKESMCRVISRLARMHGIKSHTYMLRKSHASFILRKGIQREVLNKRMGWSTYKTGDRYYLEIDLNHQHSEMQKAKILNYE